VGKESEAMKRLKLAALGILVLAACAPTTTAPPPSPGPGVGAQRPATPPAARSLDRALRETMAARLAAFTLAVQEYLRQKTGNARLSLEVEDAWLDLVSQGGRSQRFVTRSFNGEEVVVTAVSEHEADRIAIRVYDPDTGRLIHRGDASEAFDLVLAEVRGRMALEVEVSRCRRQDGCAVALGVAKVNGASLTQGRGAPISVPLERDFLPPDFWR